MKFQNSFDVYDVFAYMFPGALSLLSIALILNQLSSATFTVLASSPVFKSEIFTLMAMIGLSLIIGQVSSQFTRSVNRKIIWWWFSPSDTTSPLYVKLNSELHTRVVACFDQYIKRIMNLDSVPVNKEGKYDHDFQTLVRRYVYDNCLKGDDDFNRDTRNRSFVSNTVTPMIFLALAALLSKLWLLALFSAAISYCLFLRQADLDGRIWKETYIALAGIDKDTLNINKS